jgi:hypothetical protein
LNRIGNLLPTNEDVVRSLKTLCSDTVATIKGQLDTQKQSDVAEARKCEEEAKMKAEDARLKGEEEERQQKLAQIAAAREKLERTMIRPVMLYGQETTTPTLYKYKLETVNDLKVRSPGISVPMANVQCNKG